MSAELVDVVVIGSGFGGGTVALRLAQAGKKVCVLERGRRWRGANLEPDAFDAPSTPFPKLGESHFFWGRQFWLPTRQRLGLYDVRQMLQLQGLVGAGVGGGSLIWANVVVRAPEQIFEHGWPQGVNAAVLDAGYRKADRYLRQRRVPGVPGNPDRLKGRTVPRASMLQEAAQRLGKTWTPVDVAVTFDDEQFPLPNGHGRARQLGCNYCGMCSAGCPQNAKNSVDLTYIAAAEAEGAEIRPLHEVTGVSQISDGRLRVTYVARHINGSSRRAGAIEADRVVLSAGTFGTTELLLRARKSGGLANLSAAVGNRFSFNGNALGGALQPGVNGANTPYNSGPAITGMVDFGDVVIEDYVNPTWAAGIVGAGHARRVLSFALAMVGYKQSQKSLEALAKDLLLYVGVGRDRARGRLRLNALGMLDLQWPGGLKNEPVMRALHSAMAKTAAALGRKYVPDLFSMFGRPITYHPLGGCVMADSPQDGVVDSFGRVYGHPGLYIADGSIVPTAIGRNPAYTIAALAERVAEGILGDARA